jgi:16S rRNA (guanine966-N2)-methyltransferase
MRIIAGRYRGRRLAEYFTDTTRPTTDRVKENVFNILSNTLNFDGISVLDLFAGTGQYGIECLSRGAKFVLFNDSDAAAAEIIKKNLKNITENHKISNVEVVKKNLKNITENHKISNVEVVKKNLKNITENYKISCKDFREILKSGVKYDLIFLDPPYGSDMGEAAIGEIFEKKLLTENGIIVFETDKSDLPYPQKKYGKTYIYILQHQNNR